MLSESLANYIVTLFFCVCLSTIDVILTINTIKRLKRIRPNEDVSSIELHLLQAQSTKNKGQKGFNIREDKRNIARINTILNNQSA